MLGVNCQIKKPASVRMRVGESDDCLELVSLVVTPDGGDHFAAVAMLGAAFEVGE